MMRMTVLGPIVQLSRKAPWGSLPGRQKLLRNIVRLNRREISTTVTPPPASAKSDSSFRQSSVRFVVHITATANWVNDDIWPRLWHTSAVWPAVRELFRPTAASRCPTHRLQLSCLLALDSPTEQPNLSTSPLPNTLCTPLCCGLVTDTYLKQGGRAQPVA